MYMYKYKVHVCRIEEFWNVKVQFKKPQQISESG